MNLRTPFISPRSIAAALLLTCTAVTSAQAIPNALSFSQQASVGNYAQLATAALTLPADIFATANPDDNRLKLINHGLKLVNEALAVWQQNSPHCAAWACFDAAQSANALSAMMATRQTTNTDDETPIDAQQWQKFVRYANYVLASAEAATRVMAALENNNPTFAALGDSLKNKFVGSMAQPSEFKHGLTSLIRLARYCLQAPDKKQVAILLVLVIAEAATLFWQHKQAIPTTNTPHDKQAVTPTAGSTDGGVQAGHPTLVMLQRARPFRDDKGAVIAAEVAFNPALFEHSLSLFAIDQRVQNRDFGQCIACETAFDQWCRNHNIAPFFNLQGFRPNPLDVEATRLHHAFGAFWQQVRQDADPANRPTFIRPLNEGDRSTGSVANFCNRFNTANPALNTPAEPLSENDFQTVLPSDLSA